MRFRGRDYTGKGVTVAIVDSGINVDDPRMAGARIEGWNIQFNATGHVLLSSDFIDQDGHGTEVAAAMRCFAPDAQIFAVRIMTDGLRTSADHMAAGIETAFRNGARVISLSMGTPNMGKALLLRDCCALAVEAGANVVAAAHPGGERAYPADLPEALGVTSHPDCPMDRFYYFAANRFPRTQWGSLSGKLLAYGYGVPREDSTEEPTWRGSGLATAYMAGRIACLREALPDEDAEAIGDIVRQLSLTPSPDIGYT